MSFLASMDHCTTTARACPATSRKMVYQIHLNTETFVGSATYGNCKLALGRGTVLPAHGQTPAGNDSARSSSTSRNPPVSLFQTYEGCQLNSNRLIITLQPDEGFDLEFDVKTPGQGMNLQRQKLNFRYSEQFGSLPDGYETLAPRRYHTVIKRCLSGVTKLKRHGNCMNRSLISERPALYLRNWRMGATREANSLLAENGHRWVVCLTGSAV